MRPTTIPETSAPTQYVQLADSLGRLILIPAATVQALIAAGLESISLDVPLPGARQGGEWLTVTEAARLHLGDLPGISLENAKSKISRACESGKIRSRGERTLRRIDPISFDAWRLAQREADCDRHEEV